MSLQSNLAFVEPNDRPFRYLEAHAVGRTLTGDTVVWKLDVKTSRLTLSNPLGSLLHIGTAAKVVVRCSIAFLGYTRPYVVLEYIDNTRAIFTVDLEEEQPTLKSLDIELDQYRDVTLTYWRSMHKDKLIVTAIGEEGIYSGTLDAQDNLEMELFNRVEVWHPRREIHRVGVNVANQLQTELVDIGTDQ